MVTRRPAAKRRRQPARRLTGAAPKPSGADQAQPRQFENIEHLIQDGGDISLGRIGPVQCAATAAADWGPLAMLVRRDGESLLELLARLDAAVGATLEDPDEFIDEINAPPHEAR